MIEKYLEILGVEANASEDVLKKAYRDKAKLYHPDVSKLQNAHEKFVLLTEAYEFLMNRLKNPNYGQKTDHSKHKWTEDARQEARNQARKVAQMKYWEFINSPYYKLMIEVSKVAEYAIFILFYLIFVSLLTYMYKTESTPGVIVFSIFIVLNTVFLIRMSKRGPRLNSGSILKAILTIVKSTLFIYVFSAFLVLVFFIKFGLNTFIPDISLKLFYVVASIITGIFTFLPFPFMKKWRLYLIFGFAPMMTGLFFGINSFSKGKTIEEVHFFQFRTNAYYSNILLIPQNGVFTLENEAYQNISGIRFFPDYDKAVKSAGVKYYSHKGILGMRYLADYKFISTTDFKLYMDHYRKKDSRN